jgi:hypothetical protein
MTKKYCTFWAYVSAGWEKFCQISISSRWDTTSRYNYFFLKVIIFVKNIVSHLWVKTGWTCYKLGDRLNIQHHWSGATLQQNSCWQSGMTALMMLVAESITNFVINPAGFHGSTNFQWKSQIPRQKSNINNRKLKLDKNMCNFLTLINN